MISNPRLIALIIKRRLMVEPEVAIGRLGSPACHIEIALEDRAPIYPGSISHAAKPTFSNGSSAEAYDIALVRRWRSHHFSKRGMRMRQILHQVALPHPVKIFVLGVGFATTFSLSQGAYLLTTLIFPRAIRN